MKKLTGILTATIAAAALFLGANTVANADTTITVGASAAPHAEILRHVQPQLKKEGVNLKIKVFDDYIMPNKALANGEIDANYFQHIPFLKDWNKRITVLWSMPATSTWNRSVFTPRSTRV